jgi:restriction system protein
VFAEQILFFGAICLVVIMVTYIIQVKSDEKRRRLLEERLRKSGITEVDNMTGEMFERYLKTILQARGYGVSLTKASGDYGADLVLTNEGARIVVQAKRYKNKVGVKAVQEIVSAKTVYGAVEAWVITNNYFTEPAKKLAYSNDVMLIDRTQLINWMLEFKAEQTETA